MADSRLREINEILCAPENRSKNPVSLLMEAAAQVGETASFNFVDDTLGLSNLKIFTCEVKVGRLLKCSGSGQNKKAAKANAAEQALEFVRNSVGVSGNSPGSLESVSPSPTLRTPSPATCFSPAGTAIHDSPSTELNPIGSLQELCMKNNWTPPKYDLVSERGEAHQKTFIFECKVDSWVTQGQGKTKKLAKKLSAENMLGVIREAPSKSPSSLGDQSPSRNPFRNFPDRGCGTPGASPQLNQSSPSRRRTASPVSFLSNQLYDVMEYDDDDDDEMKFKDVASRFLTEDVSEEFCSSLEDRSKKSEFNVEYHDLPAKGYSGNYLCFVRLTTDPPTVCGGMGSTKKFAHERAAQNALQYLNTVCS